MSICVGLVVLYCGFIGGTTQEPNTNNVIKMDLEVNNGLPFSKIMIGSQRYKFMMSTWFSDFLLFSQSACDAKREIMKSGDEEQKKINPVTKADIDMCKNVQKYDDSKVLEENKKNEYEIPYLHGKLKGYIIKETIQIHDDNLQQHDIVILTDWPHELAERNKVGRFDGIFGLMFLPTEKKADGSPFFKYLIENNKIANRHFGVYFSYAHGSGELVLGGINPTYIKNNDVNSLKDVPLVAEGKGWLINIDSIKIGSNEEVGKNLKAYIDTSTTSFFGKSDVISKINTALQAEEKEFSYQQTESGENKKEKYWVFPNCKQNPPDIIITMGGHEFKVDPAMSVLNTYGVFCQPAFQAVELEGYDMILGSRFLKKYYSVFDEEKKIIRFAKDKPLPTMIDNFLNKFL